MCIRDRNATLYINGQERSSGGWGENFTFSVYTRDRFGRNVTVYAWHRIIGQDWKLIDSYICQNCLTWTQINFSYDYMCENISTWEFKFNASNDDGTSQIYGKTYSVEKDDVNVESVQPLNYEIVNRSQTTDFIVYVWDRDAQQVAPEGSRGRIYISAYTLDQWEDLGVADYWYTNASGYLVRTLTNSFWCSDKTKYYLGLHQWKGGTDGATCVKDNITLPLNFTLMGSLTNFIISPIGVNFSKELTSTIAIKGYVQDDCGDNVTDADEVYFNLTNGDYTYTCSATSVGQEYHCDFPTALAPLGWYNITMYSNKNLHWNGLAKVENAFYLASIPNLESPTVSPYPSGPWGIRPFNFSVFVTDEDNDTVTIGLWLRKDLGVWKLEDTQQCSQCNNFEVFYQRNFTCNATLNEVGDWYFKANATDISGFANQSLIVSFNVTREPILIEHYLGNNSIINRNDTKPNNTARLAVQIKDFLLNQNVTVIDTNKVRFVLTNSSTYEITSNLNSTAEYYYIDFNPDCSYSTGIYSWEVNVSQDSCYADNTSSETLLIKIVGDLNPKVVFPDGSKNFTEGEIIELVGNLSDDCNNLVGDANVYFNLTNLRTNEWFRCPSSGYATFNGTHYNCSWDSTNKPAGWYRIEIYAERSDYHSGHDYFDNAFFLVTPVRLTNPSLSFPDDGSWGEVHNFSVIVDHYESVEVCLLEANSEEGPYSITECRYIANPINTPVNFTRTYSCADQGNVLWYKFNASHPGSPGSYSETSPNFHAIKKDDLEILYVEGNETYVKRYGDDSVRFIMYLNDTDRNAPATYSSTYDSPKPYFAVFNGTDFIDAAPTLEQSWNKTNSSGYVEYYFNPDCRFEVGKQEWYAYIKIVDSCYKAVNSSKYNVSIIGLLTPNITYPDGNEFIRLDLLYINLTTHLVDECSLHNITSANVNYTIKSVAFGTQFYCNETINFNNGTYVCEWNGTEAPEGWYNLTTFTSNVSYYDDNSQTKPYAFRIIQQWVPPVLEDETVLPEDDWGWGENFTFKVNVSDLNGEDVNVSFWLSPDNQTWQFIDSQICYDCGQKTELTFYYKGCLLYTSPSPRDLSTSRMPSSA